ncbi:MAG: protein-disulfide reductase DsbD domain-containing protein [Candidatus Rariloculaceae bacterium]
MKTFGADGGRRTEVQLPQFNFAAYASQDSWRPGNTVVLVVDFDLPELMHLYAPGSDYTAANLTIVENENVLQNRLTLPEAEILYLEPIDESVPVYHGTPQIQREISLSPDYREETIAVDAILTYQTCDDEICFPPADFELTFHFDVVQHDRTRAPEEVRHPES